jgi:hypothetical protein
MRSVRRQTSLLVLSGNLEMTKVKGEWQGELCAVALLLHAWMHLWSHVFAFLQKHRKIVPGCMEHL